MVAFFDCSAGSYMWNFSMVAVSSILWSLYKQAIQISTRTQAWGPDIGLRTQMKTQLKLICQKFSFANTIQQNFTIRTVLKRLKLHQFFMVWHEFFPTHKHGSRKGGRNLKHSERKVVFLVSSSRNHVSPLMPPPLEKCLQKSTSPPSEKILPTTMHTST